jgi:hypothetical protein
MSEANDNTALVLQWSVDNAKMLRSFETMVSKIDKHIGDIEGRARRGAKNVEEAFARPNIGKALDKIFDSSRLAVLESGSSRLRIFGSALEPLGALGIGAAAGVAALGAALDQAHKAVEFADDLFKLAKNAHVTTDELQETQFALRKAGGDASQAAGGLASFNVKLGEASAGVERALRPFKELFGNHFGAADAKRLLDSGHALETVTAAIANLSSEAQKDASVQQFGLEGLKLLIESGPEKMRQFKAEALASGEVMDSALVKRGHELNEELEHLHNKIDVQLKSAFIELGPILVRLASVMADMADYAARIAGAFTPLEGRSSRVLQEELHGLQARQQRGGVEGVLFRGSDNEHIGRIQAELAKRAKEDKPEPVPKGTGKLFDQTKTHSGTDQTLSFDKAAHDAYENGLKALIAAQAALLLDVAARAEAERRAVDAELHKQTNAQGTGDLDLEEKKIRAAKHDAHKAEQIALLEKAKVEAQNTAAAKKEKIDRDLAEELRKQSLAYGQQQRDGETQLLQLEQSLTFNEQTRQRLALQLVEIAYQKVRAELEGVIASETASKADKKLAQLKLDQLNAQHPLQVEQAQRAGSGPTRQVDGIVAGIKQRSNAARDARAMYAEIERLRRAGRDQRARGRPGQARRSTSSTTNFASSSRPSSSATWPRSPRARTRPCTRSARPRPSRRRRSTAILAVQKALASAPPRAQLRPGRRRRRRRGRERGEDRGPRARGLHGRRRPEAWRASSTARSIVINAPATARNRPLLEAINAGRDIRGFLPAPRLPRSATPPSGDAGGDFHFHYNDHSQVSVADPDLSGCWSASRASSGRTWRTCSATAKSGCRARDAALPRQPRL